MSFTRFVLGKNRSSVFVFKHCNIEGNLSVYDEQLILIIFCSQRLKLLSIPGCSRTATQILGLSRAWNCLLPISGLSRIFKYRGNPIFLFLKTSPELQLSVLSPEMYVFQKYEKVYISFRRQYLAVKTAF